jgi:hypothetical protein
MSKKGEHAEGITQGAKRAVSEEVLEEGLAKRGGFTKRNGRPRKQLPLATLLRQLPSVEQQILDNPLGYDPGTGDKQLSLLGRIVFERGLCADEQQIPLRSKVALAVQILQFIEGSKSTIWKKDETKHPRTEEALAAEIAARNKRLAALKPYMAKVEEPVKERDVETVIEALRPAGDAQ